MEENERMDQMFQEMWDEFDELTGWPNGHPFIFYCKNQMLSGAAV